MVEWMIAAGVGFAILVVIGVLLSVFSVVGWVLWLPFRIVGWMFKLAGLVIAAPFILLAVLLGGFGVALSATVLFVPLFPLLALGGLAWLFFRRKPVPPAPASPPHASVVS